MSPRKVPVILTYASSGAQPPIFMAGSFSEPAWHLQEMNYTTGKDGEHEFRKEVMIDEGSQHQYKFRIGLGDWWALNEQAPTVTDELGNRNNLLTAPTHMPEESFSESSHSDFIPTPPDSQSSIPDVVVEKVDDEPRHGDDFGESSTAAQKVAHEKRAADAEPDRVIIRSQSSTPIYANTAAEVADSAVILDREASPAPIPDEEAGRTGERRLTSTPIPQVALTAAEVADSAAIIDKDAMKIDLPAYEYNPESYSAQATPGHERAPLFAHECLGPTHEDEDANEDNEPVPEKEPRLPDPLPNPPGNAKEIDINDPTLEEFPQDRVSILAHMISTETRLSEDETNFEGIPPSPIATDKSRSAGFDTPSYMRLDAQPSPLLEIIAEENQNEGVSLLKLPSPSQGLDLLKDTKEVPEDEDRGAPEEKSNSADPTTVGHPTEPPESEKIEVVKDSEHPADTRNSSLAQEPKGAEEQEIKSYSRETEKVLDRAEGKDTHQVPTGHTPDGELPAHAEETSIHVSDAPVLVENALTSVAKEVGITDKPQIASVTGEREQVADTKESKAADSSEQLTDLKQPEQKSEPPEKEAARSLDIKGLSTALGGSAVGGAIIGGLTAKDLSQDKTAQTEDTYETSTVQKALQEPTNLDANTKLSSPATEVDADAAVSELVLDGVNPGIPVRILTTDRKEAAGPDLSLSKGLKTAKSTSLDDSTANGNIESYLKMRNVASEDRAPTPASIRSAVKNSESRNFFLSIWRTVFVGWIGGLLARLWGRGSGS